MTGCKNGLRARLKSDLERSELEGIHRTANKLELAYKDAVKDLPLAKKVDLLLLGIYLIYENSYLNRSMVKRACEICQLPFLVPTRVGGTSFTKFTKELQGYCTSHAADTEPCIPQGLIQKS
ncbi:hypothetical protein Hamer_G003580 [Homarus americanus]|uniref:Uncharacterized protein n=1 Tax=Homarus americanus TaxID=6706 RepID=A0A8J5MU20_HOMAM|nr:hypothetical protein Hamer_G003580 [Homarus americanus]